MNLEQPIEEPELKMATEVIVPDDDLIQHWFTYHAPTPDNVEAYRNIRSKALAFARAINAECPDGADKSAAIRKVREAVMTANAAIACAGEPGKPTEAQKEWKVQ